MTDTITQGLPPLPRHLYDIETEPRDGSSHKFWITLSMWAWAKPGSDAHNKSVDILEMMDDLTRKIQIEAFEAGKRYQAKGE